MKKILFMLSAVIALASCSKEKMQQASTPEILVPIKKIQRNDGANKSEFNYDVNGRLQQINFGDGYVLTQVNVTPSSFNLKHFFNGVITNELDATSIINNKVVNGTSKNYTNGALYNSGTVSFTYNAAGQITQMVDIGNAVTDFEYSNGNCIKATTRSGSTVTDLAEIEYYTSLPNKMNLQFVESQYFDFKHDGAFGSPNKNLIKRVRLTNGQGQVYRDVNYVYQTDAKGYVTQFTTESNGFVETYNVAY